MNKPDRKRANAALKLAVKKAGSFGLLAEVLGCSKQTLNAAAAMGRGVSKAHAPIVHERFGIPLHDLRPDVFPLLCGLCERRADDPHIPSCTQSDCPLALKRSA